MELPVSVTVGLWTRDAGPRLERQLEALRDQRLEAPWEVCAIDVASADGSLGRLRAAAEDFPVPLRVSTLQAEEFDRGDLRNWLALRGRGDLVAFLDPGWTPASPEWLAELVRPFERPSVGAAYGLPKGAPPPAAGDAAARLPLVGAAALRRELWRRHPFARALAGEDGPTARALAAAGFELAFPPGASVEPAGPAAEPPAEPLPRTLLSDGAPLSVLYVVHGFPPDTWAGTEVYTLELAREMQRLGHRVTVLARTDGDRPVSEGGAPEFSVREDEFQGLRVLRMTRRVAVDSIRDTFDDPRAVVAFREVLLRDRPDVVHFQHLIHTSAALVGVAASFGLPTIVHCHDYWALCPRVQLVRPTGGLCPENRGAGCYLCVHERALSQIERLQRFERRRPERIGLLVEEERAQRDVSGDLRTPRGRRWEGLGDLLDRREFVPRAYAAADLRVSPSRFLRRRMIEAGGFDPRTILFSDNGLRTDRVRALEKRPDPEGRVRFGFVGSLVWYKGCEPLVEAMNALEGLPAQLGFHGDFRPESDPFHARLARRAKAGNVAFHGRFDNDRLSEVYAEIDVLVVPSLWYENSPITIHEAFLTATPVVTSDIGGMAEFVRDGVDGLHFRAGDAADLARVLQRFVDEPGLVADLSRDWIPVKDVAENARETEFRYRQLVCLERERPPILFYDHRGTDTAFREGPVEEQGPGVVLVRPGGAVEYDVSLAAGGPREVRAELVAFDAEPRLRLAGRMTAGPGSGSGARSGPGARIGPFRVGDVRAERLEPTAGEPGAVRTFRLSVELSDSDARLRLEPAGRGAALRVRRIVVRERPREAGEPSWWGQAWRRAFRRLQASLGRR